MIDLTPLEVRQKKHDFRRAFRGYDVELVNDFLDLVADRMEELVGQNLKLTDRTEALDRELAQYRQKEAALSDALMTAQRLQDETRAHAEREAELLIREAHLEAESLRQDADRALAREEDSLRQVRSRRAQLVETFRRLLERELSELTVIEETLLLHGESSEQLRLLESGAAAEGEFGGVPEGEFGGVPEGELEGVADDEEAPSPEEAELIGEVEEIEGHTAEDGGDRVEEDDWLSSLREGIERD